METITVLGPEETEQVKNEPNITSLQQSTSQARSTSVPQFLWLELTRVPVSMHRSKDNLFAKFQAEAPLLPPLRRPLSSFPYPFSEKNDIWADILNTVSLLLTERGPGTESILDLNC